MADWNELAGPAAELLGQTVGDALASGKYDQIQSLLEKTKNGYAGLPGTERLTPQHVGRSELGGVTEDSRYGGAENEALRRLMELSSGGMGAGDRAKLEQAKLHGLSVARGLRGATEDSLRRRGLYSSGAELAGDLAAQQAGINTTYQGDLATAASASDRALQALQAGGNLATSLGSRDLQQKNMAAQANDRIDQFNAVRDDSADRYNSPLAQEDALTRLKGMGATDQQIASLLSGQAKNSAAKGGGYGRQAGELLSAIFSSKDEKKTKNSADDDEKNY